MRNCVITLNRPDALNALSFALIRELGRKFDEVAGGNARALLITGAGAKAFCAGADIGELIGRPVMAQKEGAELGQQVFAKLDRLPLPSVAVINGYASAADWSLRSPATSGSRRAMPGWACPRSSWDSSRVTAVRSGCRAWWEKRVRWR
jgi:enoyl-CoA hydratase